MSAIVYTPMTDIRLSGSLARRFGRVHRRQLDSGDTWEVFKALRATLSGFEDEIRRLDRLGMRFAIFRNRKNVTPEVFDRGGTRELRIVPVVGGSKRAGGMQIVVGLVILAAVAFLGPAGGIAGALSAGGAWGTAATIGISMAVGGALQLLSPQLQGLSTSAAPENRPSYAFGSARNTTASGNPVALCIGQRRWGGAVISASIEAQDKA
ncbi:tail assembly protein [Pseudomonas alabamensis]|uniref:tail assembly protein n=1 Tax=Pseudomonas alabamensis TaxID=3064349 RepID=UPI003F651DD3